MEIDTSYEHFVVIFVKRLGYDPVVNRPTTFAALYKDLFKNRPFCDWIRSIVPCDILGAGPNSALLDPAQCAAAHIYIGERSPVWPRLWHILLSVILSGMWDEYQDA